MELSNKMSETKKVVKDIVKKIGGLGFVDQLKVTGTDKETNIEAVDNDKTVIIKAKTATPVKELEGEFGIANLQLLNGLLGFAPYNTDNAVFEVKHRDVQGKATPETFEFRDEKGHGSTFRLMDSKYVGDQPLVADIKWDVVFTPTKSKIQEFASLAGLFSSQVDQFFSVKTKEGNLVLSIGSEGSATHSASMVFQEDIQGELKGELLWPISQFLSILKMADGNDYEVGITSKGALLVSVKNELTTVQFILPARRR
jgi:hypothetical protein